MKANYANVETLTALYARQLLGKRMTDDMQKAVAGALDGARELAKAHFTKVDALRADRRLSPEGRIEQHGEIARASLKKFEAQAGDILGRVAKAQERAASAVTISRPAPSVERTMLEIEARSQLRGRDPLQIASLYLAAAAAMDDTLMLAIEGANPLLDPAMVLNADILARGLDARQRAQNPEAVAARDAVGEIAEGLRLWADDMRRAFGSDETGTDPLRKLMAEHEAERASEAERADAAMDEVLTDPKAKAEPSDAVKSYAEMQAAESANKARREDFARRAIDSGLIRGTGADV